MFQYQIKGAAFCCGVLAFFFGVLSLYLLHLQNLILIVTTLSDPIVLRFIFVSIFCVICFALKSRVAISLFLLSSLYNLMFVLNGLSDHADHFAPEYAMNFARYGFAASVVMDLSRSIYVLCSVLLIVERYIIWRYANDRTNSFSAAP